MKALMKNCMAVLVVMGCLLSASNAVAAVATSAQSGNWTNTSSWVGGTLPGPLAGDFAYIGTNHTITVSSSVTAGIAAIGYANNTGTLNVAAGGTVTAARVDVGRVGANSVGYLNLYAGGTILAPAMTIGLGAAGTPTAGTMNIYGGTILAGSMILGSAVAGDPSDYMIVHGNSSSITFTNASNAFLMRASGTLRFDFDSAGISTIFATNSASSLAGTQIIVDGTSYTGGPGTFKLIDAKSFSSTNTAVVFTGGFQGSTYTYDATNGDLFVNVIPEPATIGLLGFGAVIALLLRSRSVR